MVSTITKGPVFRRGGGARGRLRESFPPMPYDAIAGYARYWQETFKGRMPDPAHTAYTIETASISRQYVNGIYRRVVLSFWSGAGKDTDHQSHKAVGALLSHSLRVGLIPDLLRR